ncbi:sensor histidine kinase [Gryllotalpicola ginsengisoli]|uniref:sensor histidine kinase n=1 Tax=Gryllotalpicola ginsengisoli TaxID=444608 RepID=UPI0003B4DD91|nr:HAMP domain-containing sensor histidine kinase [Gryllotalpicola ginsengisoli]
MSTETGNLRSASRRLALRFAALIVALFLIVGGVVVVLVATTQHEALMRQLISAEHLDSPRDAPRGTYLAIAAQHGTVSVSADAPSGFPELSDFEEVERTGTAIERTASFGGQAYVVRTDSDSGRVVQVAVGKSESEAELRRVLLALALAGVPVAVGAALAAWWMSLRAMRPMAEALALQRRFVADAGHELRTPLTLLSTRAQLLRRALPSPADETDAAGAAAPSEPLSREALTAGLDEIVADAKTLTGILEDLLIAADPRRDAERSEVDVAAVAAEACAALRSDAAGRGIRLENVAPAPVLVNGVRVSLTRLVTALLTNALDHARSQVTVTVSAHPGEAWVEVEDDGPGFPQAVADRAFERFASARPVEPDAVGPRHYGLGLALVAEVAHRHGGAVAIVDTGGRGARVRVRLPAIARA